LDWRFKPESYKEHDNRIDLISLSDPFTNDSIIWRIISQRRSRRRYRHVKEIDKNILSTLLWSTQGVSGRDGSSAFRTTPSAGALYPIETYLNIRLVRGLQLGIYHFRPYQFDLELLRMGDHSGKLASAALSQNMIAQAPVTFIWTAIVERSKWKYNQRAYRYIYLDAGHICQNLYLAAEALGLGVCAIGAFYDDLVNGLVAVDGVSETVIYLASVGWPNKDR